MVKNFFCLAAFLVGLSGCAGTLSQSEGNSDADIDDGSAASPQPEEGRPIPPPTFVDEPLRLVALGDVHGDFQAAVDALKIAGAIDDSLSWVGGDMVVVQTGDQLDRGDGERAILDMFERLADEAFVAGGALYALNGNHETMNVEADFRYVTEGGWADFSTIPYDNDDRSLQSYAAYQRGRVAAFRPGGPYANILADHNVTMVVGDTIFVHGGILPEHVAYGLENINRGVRKFMRGESDFEAVMQGENSPVWSRHYSDDTTRSDCAILDRVLAALPAQRIVVGHTVQYAGINSECDGKIWRIDVGMAEHYGGAASVIEFVGDEVRILQ